MENPTNHTCATCRFWKPNEAQEGKLGWCRRRAPQVVVTRYTLGGDYDYMSHFPDMQPSGWCGEHEPDKANGG